MQHDLSTLLNEELDVIETSLKKRDYSLLHPSFVAVIFEIIDSYRKMVNITVQQVNRATAAEAKCCEQQARIAELEQQK